jgi:hypothetical protein
VILQAHQLKVCGRKVPGTTTPASTVSVLGGTTTDESPDDGVPVADVVDCDSANLFHD